MSGVVDQAVADQVVADAAGQFPGLFCGAGQQQDVAAGQVIGDVATAGQVGCLFWGTAAEPGVLVVAGEHGGVADAEAEAGVAFPVLGEPNGFGELGVAELADEHRHGAAALDGRELLVIASDQDFAIVLGSEAENGGEVGDRRRGCLVKDQQRARRDGLGAAGLAAAFEVAEEPGDVVGGGDASFVQDVRGRLGDGQAVDLTDLRLLPERGGSRGGMRLAGAGPIRTSARRSLVRI